MVSFLPMRCQQLPDGVRPYGRGVVIRIGGGELHGVIDAVLRHADVLQRHPRADGEIEIEQPLCRIRDAERASDACMASGAAAALYATA